MSLTDSGRRADALGLYLTGAASDGGAQVDPDAALGNYRSSSEARIIGGLVSDAIPPVIVDRIAGQNEAGQAQIRADGASTLYYTAPSGTEGIGTVIASGESKILEDTDTEKIIRVTRDDPRTLAGVMVLDLVSVFNNAVGMTNVSNAQRAAGVHTYRGLMLRPHGAFGVLDIRLWLDSMAGEQATIQIGLEAPDGDNKIQTIANENTAPGGIAWNSSTTKSSGLYIVGLDVDENYGLWIDRSFPGAGDQSDEEEIKLYLAFWGA